MGEHGHVSVSAEKATWRGSDDTVMACNASRLVMPLFWNCSEYASRLVVTRSLCSNIAGDAFFETCGGSEAGSVHWVTLGRCRGERSERDGK